MAGLLISGWLECSMGKGGRAWDTARVHALSGERLPRAMMGAAASSPLTESLGAGLFCPRGASPGPNLRSCQDIQAVPPATSVPQPLLTAGPLVLSVLSPRGSVPGQAGWRGELAVKAPLKHCFSFQLQPSTQNFTLGISNIWLRYGVSCALTLRENANLFKPH